MRTSVFWWLSALGVLAVVWVGASHAASNPWVLAVCLLIAGVFVAGVWGLAGYRKASARLRTGLQALPAAQAGLEAWLLTQDASLRAAVRLRILGERVALPAPTLPAYLSGVLVLLGMLGTLAGMMAALQGTGIALETASDLQAVRDTLAAPVRGLGYAFGTSIAGIASSAVLGVLAALCRRERQALARDLDAAIAGPLHVFTRGYQQDDSWRLLREQAGLLPALVDRLQGLAAAIEQRDIAQTTALQAQQHAFHHHAQAAYEQLAASVQQSLQASIVQASEASSRALQPVAQAAMAGIGDSTRALHAHLTQALQTQARETSEGLHSATVRMADLWTQALEGQRQQGASMLTEVQATLQHTEARREAQATALQTALGQHMQASVQGNAEVWAQALAQLQAAQAAQQTQQQTCQQALLAQQQAQQQASEQQRQHEWQAAEQQRQAAWLAAEQQQQAARQAQEQALQARQDLLETQRRDAWRDTGTDLMTQLSGQWQQAGEAHWLRQQQASDALRQHLDGLHAGTQQQASAMLAEVSKLMQAAAEAPRAAAEVMAELRQSLSDSLQRDSTMLAERNQLLGALGSLLGTVNQASTQQREAIDALVLAGDTLLARASERFDARVEADAARLDAAATRASLAAVEVASLGDVFAAAVASFEQGNTALLARLQGLEGALEKTILRSDEQLAYYIAQAREVVDLSVLSQRQIVADLKTLSAPQGLAADAPA
jgi:hypothetical protein